MKKDEQHPSATIQVDVRDLELLRDNSALDEAPGSHPASGAPGSHPASGAPGSHPASGAPGSAPGSHPASGGPGATPPPLPPAALLPQAPPPAAPAVQTPRSNKPLIYGALFVVLLAVAIVGGVKVGFALRAPAPLAASSAPPPAPAPSAEGAPVIVSIPTVEFTDTPDAH